MKVRIVVGVIHLVPAWFFFVNVRSANTLWREIHECHTADEFFGQSKLTEIAKGISPAPPKKTVFRISTAPADTTPPG